MNSRYILLLTLLTLGACGFHLRGTQVNATKAGVAVIAVKSLSAQQGRQPPSALKSHPRAARRSS